MADQLKVCFKVCTLLGPQFIVTNMQAFFSIKKVICILEKVKFDVLQSFSLTFLEVKCQMN